MPRSGVAVFREESGATLRMKQIDMVARQDFTHVDGREIASGMLFSVRPIEAAVLNRNRRARFATEEDRHPASEPETEQKAFTSVAPPARTRRPRKPRKNRRDITQAPITK